MRFIPLLIPLLLIVGCSMNQLIPLAKHKHTDPATPYGQRVDASGRAQPMGFANVISLLGEASGGPGGMAAGGAGIVGLISALMAGRKRKAAQEKADHHERVARQVIGANQKYMETLPRGERSEFKEIQHRSHASAGMAEAVGEIARDTRDDASTR